jgi:hypothetical protein
VVQTGNCGAQNRLPLNLLQSKDIQRKKLWWVQDQHRTS